MNENFDDERARKAKVNADALLLGRNMARWGEAAKHDKEMCGLFL